MSDFASITLMSLWLHPRSLIDYFPCSISSAVGSFTIMPSIQGSFFFKVTEAVKRVGGGRYLDDRRVSDHLGLLGA